MALKRWIRRNQEDILMGGGMRDVFGSKMGVIAAAAGSAVGLGNVWKFPYAAGNNGGAAFILVYLFFILIIGLPVMLSEFVIGRKSRKNVHGSFAYLAPRSAWPVVGYMGILAAFMILAFYGVVGGWAIQYIGYALFDGFSGKTPQELKFMYENFVASPIKPIIWQLLFMAVTCWIVVAGVRKGIERYAKILMPTLLVIILILDVKAITYKGAAEGLQFLFYPDFSKLTSSGVLEALGQAFFSLSLGMGAIITYGSYVNKKDNLTSTTVEVSVVDTLIAILAGIAIFPAVFAFHVEPDVGEGLVFITLPNVFQLMSGGQYFAILFFLLLFVAAITSSISLLEVVVAFLVEEKGMDRKIATIMVAALISIFGMLCSLSLGSTVKIEFLGKSFFTWLVFLSSDLLLPLGGMLIALFVGWRLGAERTHRELSNEGVLRVRLFYIYMFLLRFVVPFAIGVVLINGLWQYIHSF